MAETALEIVSLAAVKSELRIAAGDNSQDTLLTRHIQAAVDYVQQSLSLPLLDRARSQFVPPPYTTTDPLRFNSAFVIGVQGVDYWSADAPVGGEPDETIVDLGRRMTPRFTYYTLQWANDPDGWPNLQGRVRRFRIRWTEGMDFADNELASLREGALLVAAKLYDGESDFASVDRMLLPWRRYD